MSQIRNITHIVHTADSSVEYKIGRIEDRYAVFAAGTTCYTLRTDKVKTPEEIFARARAAHGDLLPATAIFSA